MGINAILTSKLERFLFYEYFPQGKEEQSEKNKGGVREAKL